MGRVKKEISEDELSDALEQFENQYDVADYFGVSQATISNRVNEYGLGATAETITPRDPRIERPAFSYEETKEVLLEKEEETAETVGYYEVNIEIDTNLPLRILPMADWHIGSRHTASRRLFECTDKIIEDPQTFTTLNGDLIDNYNTSSYKQGQIEQEIKIQDQKIHAESIIKELAPSTLSILNGYL